MLYNDSHTLRFRAEWEVLQDIILFSVTIRIDKFDAGFISIYKFHFEYLGKLHQSDLIGTCSLEFFLVWVILIRIDWCHIMAK